MTEASQAAGHRSGGRESAPNVPDGGTLEAIRERLLIEPRDADALGRAGVLLYEMGEFEQAVAHLDKALSCCHCPLGGPASRPSRPAERGSAAAPPLRQEATRNHYTILKQLADCHAAVGDCPQAERHYRAAAALSPEHAEPYIGLGTLALQQRQVDRAEQFFQTARRREPDCGGAYGGLAMVHQHRLEHAEAFEMYLKCLELDGDNLVALLGLFQTSCRMGSFSKLIHYLEVFLERHPADTSVLFCLATLQARQGLPEQTQQNILKVHALEPDKQQAAELLGELEDALGGVSDGQEPLA